MSTQATLAPRQNPIYLWTIMHYMLRLLRQEGNKPLTNSEAAIIASNMSAGQTPAINASYLPPNNNKTAPSGSDLQKELQGPDSIYKQAFMAAVAVSLCTTIIKAATWCQNLLRGTVSQSVATTTKAETIEPTLKPDTTVATKKGAATDIHQFDETLNEALENLRQKLGEVLTKLRADLSEFANKLEEDKNEFVKFMETKFPNFNIAKELPAKYMPEITKLFHFTREYAAAHDGAAVPQIKFATEMRSLGIPVKYMNPLTQILAHEDTASQMGERFAAQGKAYTNYANNFQGLITQAVTIVSSILKLVPEPPKELQKGAEDAKDISSKIETMSLNAASHK